MADMIKSGWFGKRIRVLMANDKSVSGVLSEVTENYLVLTQGDSEIQVMCPAIIAVRLAPEGAGQEQG